MTTPDYSATFGDDGRRLLRGQILGGLLGLSLYDIPRFRDAWVERWQNPDREQGVGPLIIAIYTESLGIHRKNMASKIFTMRAHPLYRSERDDTVVDTYTVFYFNAPADLDEETRASMIARAVPPVDTNSRWATALGLSQRTGN